MGRRIVVFALPAPALGSIVVFYCASSSSHILKLRVAIPSLNSTSCSCSCQHPPSQKQGPSFVVFPIPPQYSPRPPLNWSQPPISTRLTNPRSASFSLISPPSPSFSARGRYLPNPSLYHGTWSWFAHGLGVTACGDRRGTTPTSCIVSFAFVMVWSSSIAITCIEMPDTIESA